MRDWNTFNLEEFEAETEALRRTYESDAGAAKTAPQKGTTMNANELATYISRLIHAKGQLRALRTDTARKIATLDRRYTPEVLKTETEKIHARGVEQVADVAPAKMLAAAETALRGAEKWMDLERYVLRNRIEHANADAAARAQLLTRMSTADLATLAREAAELSHRADVGRRYGELFGDILAEARFRAEAENSAASRAALHQVTLLLAETNVPEHAQTGASIAELRLLLAQVQSTANAIRTGGDDVELRNEAIAEVSRRRDAGEDVSDGEWRAALAIA